MIKVNFDTIVQEVLHCKICEPFLPLGCKPVFQIHPDAKILLVGQAPGKRVHETGLPFNDVSGDRLRNWLSVDRATFYDAQKIALLPMGFCYPGTGKSGDLPPRPECAAHWRKALLSHLPNIQCTVAIGQYARDWHFPEEKKWPLAKSVAGWKQHWPEKMVIPHPSPRNIRWFRKHPWFEAEVVPMLKNRVTEILAYSYEE